MNGHKFIRQAPVGPFFCDFLRRERALVVEVDSGQHAERSEYDSTRSAYLEQQGLKVLRFWNNDVLKNTSSVLEVILLELDQREPRFVRSHPQPPPASGRRLA